MTRLVLGLVAGAALWSSAGAALAEDRPLRPEPRPMALVAQAAGLPLIRPRARPAAEPAPAVAATPTAVPAAPVLSAAPVSSAAPALPVTSTPPVVAALPLPLVPKAEGTAPALPLAGTDLHVSTAGPRLPLAVPPVAGARDALTVPVAAAGGDTPRPRSRQPATVQTTVAALPAPPALRPRSRPAMATPALFIAPPETALLAGISRSLRPEPRPKGLAQRRAKEAPALLKAAAVKTQPGGVGVVSRKGSVCGLPEVKGATLAPITAKVSGCGVAEPVKVTEVAGIRLSQPAIMDCTTAAALKTWVERGVKPNFRKTPVVELKVAGHYVCRTRNHKKGAKISEHGKGRAIDISGFTLANGKTISILKGWRGDYGPAIRAAHKAACGPFGTTLGPGSDGYHEDHLHFDTARYRKGAYCR